MTGLHIRIFTGSLAVVLEIGLTAAATRAAPPGHYHVIHGWPVLATNQVLDEVSAVAVDSHDRVMVLTRAGRQWPDNHPQSRVRLTAHSATEWHISKVPVLVVQPVSSGIEVQLDGTSAQQIQGAGSWILVPPQTRYRIRNAGAASADAVAIQIK